MAGGESSSLPAAANLYVAGRVGTKVKRNESSVTVEKEKTRQKQHAILALDMVIDI
jgi:hypothetical protein